MDRYFVLCRSDRVDCEKGKYELATKKEFDFLIKAIEYADSIHPSREPLVVKVVWNTEE